MASDTTVPERLRAFGTGECKFVGGCRGLAAEGKLAVRRSMPVRPFPGVLQPLHVRRGQPWHRKPGPSHGNEQWNGGCWR